MREVYGGGQKSLAMSFTYPIKDDAGKIVGVWSNRLNWEVAQSILGEVLARAKANGGDTQRFILMNDEGTVLHSFKPPETLKKSHADKPVVKLALRPMADGYYTGEAIDGTGVERIFGYHRSVGYSTYPGLGWAVVSSRVRSEALASASALAKRSMIVAAIATVLMLLVAVLFSGAMKRGIQAILERIRQLSEEDAKSLENALGELAGGNLTVTVEPVTLPIEKTGGDEIGQVAVAAVEDGATRTAAGVATVEHTRGAFERIEASIDDISGRVQQIAASVRGIADGAERMQGEIGEVATVAEASSASSEQVSAAAQQTSASTQEIAASALASTAEQLEQLVGRFRLEV